MPSSLYLQCCCQVTALLVLHDQSRIDVSFDPVRESVELLLSSDKLAELELELVLLWKEDLIQPLCYVFHSPPGVLFDLTLLLVKRE